MCNWLIKYKIDIYFYESNKVETNKSSKNYQNNSLKQYNFTETMFSNLEIIEKK